MTLGELPQQYHLNDSEPEYHATVVNGVIDIHSPRRSYSCLVDDAAYTLLCEAKAINELLESLEEKRQRIAALETELLGERKANAILNAGMGSVCEGRDELKHENRALKTRIAELEAALRPFAELFTNALYTMTWGDASDEEPAPQWPFKRSTHGDCRRAAAVLAKGCAT